MECWKDVVHENSDSGGSDDKCVRSLDGVCAPDWSFGVGVVVTGFDLAINLPLGSLDSALHAINSWSFWMPRECHVVKFLAS